MKKYIINTVAVLLSLASVFACRQADVEVSEQKGYLYVNLDRDGSEDVVFKAANVEDFVFSLKIYNALDQLVAQVDDYRDLATTPLELNVGKYTAVASSAPAAAAAAFDAPFYSGSSEIEILPEQVTNADIVCTLANVKVTTVFSDEIKNKFSVYKLTVTNGEGTLIFSNTDDTIGKEGYFSATGTLKWTLFLENNDGQQYTALTETYTDVKPRQHYNLSFSMEETEDFGGGSLIITVDNSLVEKDYNITLDFGDETVPQISADFEYTAGQPVEFNAGDNTSKVLTMTSADGFKNLILSYPQTVSETANVSLSGTRSQVELVGAPAQTLSDLAAAGIVVSAVEYGATTASIDLTAYIANQPIGECPISVIAADVNGAYVSQDINFVLRSPVETEALSADPWAMFAVLKGKYFASTAPAGITFQYKKTADTEWNEIAVSAISTNTSARTFSTELRGLEPETEYVFRAVSAKDKETKEITFVTETAGTLHNMSFDSWWYETVQNNKVWYPNESSDFSVWDTANPGSGGFGIIPTTPTSDVAVSGTGKQAAKCESLYAFIAFAAGNVYTGKFGAVDRLGAYLDWGVPFTSRPLALKGYYKYLSKVIDKVKAPYESLKGTQDICQIQILLTDWDKPFTVNTNTGSFVDFENDPNIIAYGKFESDQTIDNYEEFSIKLDYRDTTRTPKYIVITCCSSKYGDYFTGGVGSTLCVDEFEFVYDPDLLGE